MDDALVPIEQQEEHALVEVLILVVMDDALVRAFGSANSYTLSFVLILVVMDDALVQDYLPPNH